MAVDYKYDGIQYGQALCMVDDQTHYKLLRFEDLAFEDRDFQCLFDEDCTFSRLGKCHGCWFAINKDQVKTVQQFHASGSLMLDGKPRGCSKKIPPIPQSLCVNSRCVLKSYKPMAHINCEQGGGKYLSDIHGNMNCTKDSADKGKTCQKSSDCMTGICIVDQRKCKDQLKKNCKFVGKCHGQYRRPEGCFPYLYTNNVVETACTEYKKLEIKDDLLQNPN